MPPDDHLMSAMNPQDRQLQDLHESIMRCKRCPLHETRLNAVPGEGPSNASILFIGEAPGAREDETGRPFVGRSGQLLTRLLRDVGIARDEVFITSILKCRPPNNRTPHRSEVEACREHLERQIEMINPKVIVLLGGVAISSIIGPWKVSEAHGNFFEGDEDRMYFMTFHPAAALRFPKTAELMTKDLKKIKEWL
ncbi:MAG: uracil-DNA glycosylase [Candidatus Thorarchaeota archaeon]